MASVKRMFSLDRPASTGGAQGRYKERRPYGVHHLRFRMKDGYYWVLHATKGWKRVGRVS